MEFDVSRGLLGALISFILLMAFQAYLVRRARARAEKEKTNRLVKFWDLIITSEDESYSLSRFQMYIWTIVVIIGFSAIFMATLKFPDIPENLYLLMGVNLTAAVTSTAINTWKEGKDKKTDEEKLKRKENLKNKLPDFVTDIFFEKKDSLDLPRTQMFAWTIVSLLGFIALLIKCFYYHKPLTSSDGTPSLPDITLGLVALMGISHGAYLGIKAASNSENKTEPKKEDSN